MTDVHEISPPATTTEEDHLNTIQVLKQSNAADPEVEIAVVQNKDTSELKLQFGNEQPIHDNKEDQDLQTGDPTDTNADNNNILKPLTEEEIDAIVQKHAKMADEEKQKYLDFFWSVDTYKFGVFTIHQLAYRLRNSGVWLNNQQLAKIFSDVDANNDFLVSLDEYLQEMSKQKPKPITTKELELWFKRFDRDQDGYVCRDDINAVMVEENGIHIMSLEVEEIMRFDRSGRAERLNFKDFCTAVERML